MLKAVIDTSVIISGLIKSPSCRRILNALEKSEFILIISPDILAELIDVLTRPKFQHVIKQEAATSIIEAIQAHALFVKPSITLNVIADDPDDNCFLEAALTTKANCLVSLDNHLLALKKFRTIPIITPPAFLRLLAKTK